MNTRGAGAPRTDWVAGAPLAVHGRIDWNTADDDNAEGSAALSSERLYPSQAMLVDGEDHVLFCSASL